MNTFEKMLFLKSISFFKSLKEEILLNVAAALTEENIPPNTLIIQKGSLDAAMYMIVTGCVQVHDGTQKIAELRDRDVFGELAALYPEKRIADVSTIDETLLLKIDHDTLYDLIEMDSALAKGLIEMLCLKIRHMAASKT